MADQAFSNTQVEQLEKVFNELLSKQAETILDAVESHVRTSEKRVAEEIQEFRGEITTLTSKINDLVGTLDAFLKRTTTAEDEFNAIKYELNQVKVFLKEKLDFTLD